MPEIQNAHVFITYPHSWQLDRIEAARKHLWAVLPSFFVRGTDNAKPFVEVCAHYADNHGDEVHVVVSGLSTIRTDENKQAVLNLIADVIEQVLVRAPIRVADDDKVFLSVTRNLPQLKSVA